jgi:flavin reductase (DIM6/NTAB) family NADH-FMN oxidoreductase RutF
MKIETAKLSWLEAHDLLGTVVAPLPVALISTIGPDGTHNAAPFSFIAPVCSKPPIVCITIGLRQGQKKDTLRNIEFSRDFVVNVVDETMISKAVQTSADYPSDVDEIKEVELTAISSEKVKSPRVAESKASLECQLVQKSEIPEEREEGEGLRAIVFGKVVMAHVRDEFWVGGKVDPARLGMVGRVGERLYCRTGDIFEMKPS